MLLLVGILAGAVLSSTFLSFLLKISSKCDTNNVWSLCTFEHCRTFFSLCSIAKDTKNEKKIYPTLKTMHSRVFTVHMCVCWFYFILFALSFILSCSYLSHNESLPHLTFSPWDCSGRTMCANTNYMIKRYLITGHSLHTDIHAAMHSQSQNDSMEPKSLYFYLSMRISTVFHEVSNFFMLKNPSEVFFFNEFVKVHQTTHIKNKSSNMSPTQREKSV